MGKRQDEEFVLLLKRGNKLGCEFHADIRARTQTMMNSVIRCFK
jgi:hypothetical protein